MKKVISSLIGTLILLAIVCVAYGGWVQSVETNFTGTTYTWWNTNSSPRHINIKSCMMRWDTVIPTNAIQAYILDANTNAFRFYISSVQTNIQYASFTPDGNGEIVVPHNHGLRIIQTVTNKAYIIIDPVKPE